MFRHTSRMSQVLVPIAAAALRPRHRCLRQRLRRLIDQWLHGRAPRPPAARS